MANKGYCKKRTGLRAGSVGKLDSISYISVSATEQSRNFPCPYPLMLRRLVLRLSSRLGEGGVSPSKRRRDCRGLDKPIEIILSTLFIRHYTSKSLLSDGSYKQVVDVPFLYSKGTVLKTMTALKKKLLYNKKFRSFVC
jgi:hypothetical protein